MKCLSEKRPFAIIAIAFSFVLLSVPTSVWAGDVPLSHEADPDVYRVIAENENFRVIVATWQPGQQDAPHSHPANAAYRLTDCKNRIFKLDGSIAREGEVKAGSVVLQDPVPGHSFKNMSDNVCQTLIVESK
jgi:predicted metal-dependent enzyme (double-stranded beta helix superfamily)